MGREAFVAKVWEWKEQSGGTILEQSRRLGDSFDLSRNRFTMDEGFHDAVLKVFVDFYDKGLIYRGKRLVNWDPHFETAISDLEVEQVEEKGHLWRLRYPLENGATYEHPTAWDDEGRPTASETRDYLVVATTRPETMLGDTGVAVHPDDPRYAPPHRQDRPPAAGRPLHPHRRRPLRRPGEGHRRRQDHPRPRLQRLGRRPAAEPPRHQRDGHARSHRAQGQRRLLGGRRPADELADLDGLDRYEARDLVLTLAEEQGWLDGADPETHTVPHGDRSKVAIEPFLTDQWYVDAATLAKPALAAVRDGRTRILPERDEKTYFHWLENIEPWCISRQLWWGHQIPVWYGDTSTPEGSAPCTEAASPAATSRTCCHEHGRWLRRLLQCERRCRARGCRERYRYAHRPTGRSSASKASREDDGGDSPRSARPASSRCAATPTSSTPGSPPASGPSAPSAGPRTRPSSAATTRPPRSSPASTSSSSGSPG